MNQTNKDALDKLQEQLERKLNITDEKAKQVLSDDLADSLTDVLDYCNRDTLIGNMITSVKDLFIIRYNQEGNEGETSRSEGGVSQTFETGIPLKIRSKLNRYRVASMRSLL
ncbi:phage head-tail connector protein [Enterococcus caccae]|uniref:Uncharacterized protein n=1 Tax=Enterococcus caccae ATCC BAA-1240 TaxID=1158612 RepID=R3WD41_9ENTE|nr:phage head-tail connector protein [Enterococcus caccae]EOL45816.1 hypothetical protein UC7_01613 [Enterococcus caccae ATCC BAA-1240]EOT61012.1 hypothetical protein I580_01914 [Enterococcus caccae ATCC BAA-1240]